MTSGRTGAREYRTSFVGPDGLPHSAWGQLIIMAVFSLTRSSSIGSIPTHCHSCVKIRTFCPAITQVFGAVFIAYLRQKRQYADVAAKTPLARYTSDGLAVAGEIGRHSVPESNQFCLRDIMQLQTG